MNFKACPIYTKSQDTSTEGEMAKASKRRAEIVVSSEIEHTAEVGILRKSGAGPAVEERWLHSNAGFCGEELRFSLIAPALVRGRDETCFILQMLLFAHHTISGGGTEVTPEPSPSRCRNLFSEVRSLKLCHPRRNA